MSNQKRKYSLVYTEKDQVVFRKDKPLHIRILILLALYILLSVNPVDKTQWLLGTLGALAVILFLIPLYRKSRLSNLSYSCILIFLLFHLIGAHYSYSLCPAGEWAKGVFGFRRNNYDRLVSLAFGVLASYPVIELLYTKLRVRYMEACAFSLAIILSMSSLVELAQMYIAFLLDYQEAAVIMGMQGDMWDSQKDLTACLAGAVLSLGIRILLHIKKSNRIQVLRRIK